jgi:cytochrome c peroxidase
MQNNKIFKSLLLVFALLISFPLAVQSKELVPLISGTVLSGNDIGRKKVELGKKLFFDRRLSGDGTMSCVTCHEPESAFTDGMPNSLHYPTTRNWRNAPTLVNLALNKYLFHDGRATSIEEQALFPILSAFEMNQNLDYLEEELRSVPEYVREFEEVFGSEDITRERIAQALAAFERTLVSQNSPLDKFLKGDKSALSKEAREGLDIFKGKGKCTQCHHGQNLNDDDFHALNVPEHPDFQDDPRVAATRRFVAKLNNFEAYRTLDEDPGRYLITKKKEDWRAFKTPTLREITYTAPYMHNGIFETLDEVIDFFNKGGGRDNTALKPLDLTIEEKSSLKKFLLEGLSGERIVFSFPLVP